MPEIKRIHTRPYNLPLRSALKWGKGHQLNQLEHVLIMVELSDGAIGIAEATPRPSIYGETQASVMTIINAHLVSLIKGEYIETTDDIDRIEQMTAIIKNNNTARGALNIALHMALARSQGRAVAELIGATSESTNLSYILGTGTIDTVLDEVAHVYAQGIRCLKVKVGKDLDREVALVGAIHDLYGDALTLYADANQCLTVANALPFLETLAEMGVCYCEEPIPVHHLRQRAELRKQSPMPLIGDDACFTLTDVERELAFETIDILNIKTARTGFSQSRQISNQAIQNNIGVMVGSQASSLLGCLHAIIFACQPHIAHETEGSFFLKVEGEHHIGIQHGAVRRVDAEAMLTRLEDELLSQKFGVGG